MRAARRWTGVFAVVLAATLLPCTPASAASDVEAIAALNAQRALNGIPANLRVSSALSDGCAKHIAYIARNGGGLTHTEEPAKPGYTAEGAGLAGGTHRGEVLKTGPDYWDNVSLSPWTDSPLHKWLMFQPAGGAAGYAADGRTSCMRFGLDGGASAGGYAFPGGDATGVPVRVDTSRESPYSPADLVGVSDTQSGPPIVLYRVGARADIARATLASAAGPAEIRLVDSRTPALDGTPNRFGSYVVPVRPLDSGTRYTLDVVFTDGGTYRTTFTTAGNDPGLQITGRYARGLVINVASAAGVPAALSAFRAGSRRVIVVQRAAGPVGVFRSGPLRSGRYNVCAEVGGPGTGYDPSTKCVTIAVAPTRQSVRLRRVRRTLVVTASRPTGSARRATIRFTNRLGRRVGRARTVTLSGTRRVKIPRGARKATLTAKARTPYPSLRMTRHLA